MHILRMVDPVNRHGHAEVLKSWSKDDIFYSSSHLITVVHVQPTISEMLSF
jgi:hypothetical protein